MYMSNSVWHGPRILHRQHADTAPRAGFDGQGLMGRRQGLMGLDQQP